MVSNFDDGDPKSVLSNSLVYITDAEERCLS